MIRLALALILLAGQAGANCAPVADVVETLIVEYDERPVATMSTAGSDAMMFANPKTGTWTFVELMPDGSACLRGYGMGYEDVSPLVTGDPA